MDNSDVHFLGPKFDKKATKLDNFGSFLSKNWSKKIKSHII